jgi:MFS family permease
VSDRPAGFRALLRVRDARLLLAGQALSLLGDRAMLLVFGIWAKELTGSNTAAGLALFAVVAPAMLSPLGGVLVDRTSRRRLLIAIYLATAVALLPLFAVHGRGQLFILYAVAVAYGASLSLSGAAQSALLATVLPSDLLAAANGAVSTAQEASRLVAPLLGAGLFARFGAAPVVVLDIATFVAAAALLTAVRAREGHVAPRRGNLRAEVVAGVRHVLATPPLRDATLAAAVAMLAFGFSESFVFAIVDQGLHRAPAFLGVLSTVQGVGAIAGGLSAARVLARVGDVRLVGLGLAVAGGGEALLATSSLPVVLAGMLVAGTGVPWAIVGLLTAVQTRSPAELQGRVYGTVEMLLSTPQTLSIAVGAGLLAVVDYRLLIAATVVVVLGVAIVLLGATHAAAVPSGPHSKAG